VARAEEIIRACCREPLSIQDLATSLGVTVRALQMGFRRHLGCTPMQYLLSRRLEMARERMLAPDAQSNVQYVAMSCGFINMSKFSSRYRAMFGELPSETLARGRRR
jgi:transcriptional regulator GlxA family with amidase domain